MHSQQSTKCVRRVFLPRTSDCETRRATRSSRPVRKTPTKVLVSTTRATLKWSRSRHFLWFGSAFSSSRSSRRTVVATRPPKRTQSTPSMISASLTIGRRTRRTFIRSTPLWCPRFQMLNTIMVSAAERALEPAHNVVRKVYVALIWIWTSFTVNPSEDSLASKRETYREQKGLNTDQMNGLFGSFTYHSLKRVVSFSNFSESDCFSKRLFQISLKSKVKDVDGLLCQHFAANFVWLTSPEMNAFNKRSFSDRFGIY